MDKLYTKEDMQPMIDFMSKYLDLLPQEGHRTTLKKVVDNFNVALKAAADNVEKHAYLYALYVNNASAMASTLFEYHALTKEAQEEYYKLPSRADADAVLAPYRDKSQAESNDINERQKAFVEHNRGLEVFKGIALGDSPEDAKASVAAYEKKVAEAMGGQQ